MARHLDGSLRVFKYHGKDRKKHLSDIEHCDIVITTYNTLAREHGIKNNGGSQSPLHDIEWYRVVLDEGKFERREKSTMEVLTPNSPHDSSSSHDFQSCSA
jgi:SNF2 family DNA or RNA helicase